MDGLSVAGSVAGVLSIGIQVTQCLVDFYSAYKSQKSDAAHTIKKLERLFGVLENLHHQLADRTYLASEQDPPNIVQDEIRDCEECIRELQSEADKFKGNTTDGIRAAARTASYKVTYPFRQSTLQKLEENINEIVSHLSLALQVLGQKDISNTQDDIKDAKALLDLVRADQISSTIREWLKAPDATVNYNEACAKRYRSTGRWLVEGSSFSSWLTKPNSFLWLNGFAGCGKSVLCSTAIQYAHRHRRSNPRIGIAFFFFSFNDDAKQDTSAMLRALVLQLSGQLNDNHGLLSQLHKSYLTSMPTNQALMNCLRQLVRAFDDAYLIVDALDESSRDRHRSDMLQALVDLRTWAEPGLHLLVTSREEPDIYDALSNEPGALPAETISLKNGSVDTDIKSFISGSLKDDRQLRKWEKYHDQIKKALTERAKGVCVLFSSLGEITNLSRFRWVECQFKALISCAISKKRLNELLASLPPSLDKTYERILLGISEDSIVDARRILTLLCCAKRPLTVPEIIEGIAVELGDNPRLDIDARLDNEDDMHRLCPGLIEIDFHPGHTQPTVRIAHFSVQEYLESERIQQHAVVAFGVKRPEAHAKIASICLTYLLEPISLLLISEYPFALYAAKHWNEHYDTGDQTSYRVEHQMIRLFRSTGGEFENWVRIWNHDPPNGHEPRGEMPSRLYYASLLGLDLAVSETLCEASFTGLSLARASDLVNAQGGHYGNALQAASAKGHKKIVQLLLDKGAHINAQGGHHGNALQAALYGDHEKVIQLLLEKGAHVNAQGGHYGNALQAASCNGHEKVVQLLLDKGAHVNAQGGHYGNALQAASESGHEKVVQLLLDKGAHVNAEGGISGRPREVSTSAAREVS